MRASVFFFAGAIALAPQVAWAQERETAPASAAESRSDSREPVWYGEPIIALDLAGVTMFHVGLGTGAGALTASGAALYLGGSPVVHFAHEEIGRGVGALALRAGLPLAGGLVGLGVGILMSGIAPAPAYLGQGAFGTMALGGTVGFELGLIGASVIDIAAIARKPPPPTARDGGLQGLTPTLTIAHDAGSRQAPMVGLAGAF